MGRGGEESKKGRVYVNRPVEISFASKWVFGSSPRAKPRLQRRAAAKASQKLFDRAAFGCRAGRVMGDHSRRFPVPGQHDFRGTRAPGSQFARQPNPATVRRQVRLDTGGACRGGEAALNLQRRQPDHTIRRRGGVSIRAESHVGRVGIGARVFPLSGEGEARQDTRPVAPSSKGRPRPGHLHTVASVALAVRRAGAGRC